MVYGIYRNFQEYFSYIVAVSLIGGGNRSTQYLLFLRSARSIKEKEQKLLGSESEYYVRVEQHVYPRTAVSVN